MLAVVVLVEGDVHFGVCFGHVLRIERIVHVHLVQLIGGRHKLCHIASSFSDPDPEKKPL